MFSACPFTVCEKKRYVLLFFGSVLRGNEEKECAGSHMNALNRIAPVGKQALDARLLHAQEHGGGAQVLHHLGPGGNVCGVGEHAAALFDLCCGVFEVGLKGYAVAVEQPTAANEPKLLPS